ncbi:hypothetical protein Psi02_50950 [Planotetraspora silvatica]|uniref:DUF7779 domain-containing protein n=2 Tax=Planotetraspora silvatica TaxID=234614 RepID=A0A8J3UQ78_9ACTN|nr:hypothetical protein Psi02_50950 [Planotetraspora silvatica]
MRSPTPTAVIAHTPTPQALHGLGGVGKTQLVTEYAWKFRHSYQVVWWVTADQPSLVPATLAGLAPELGLPPASLVGIEEAAAAVRKALQQGDPYEDWLLIFDNADDPESIRELIPDGGPGHVLITSRNTRWSAATESIAVDVFDREESVAFLRKRLGKDLDTAEADRLAEALGDLPLAIEQAAAYRVQTGMTTDEYITELDRQTRRTLTKGKSTDYPQSMTAAWQLSVQAIEQRMPEAATLLRCLAFFGPEPIPMDVFRRGNKAIASGALGPILTDPLMLFDAFGELGRFALARIDQETGTIQVHRLVQALLRDTLLEDEQREVRHEVHLLLAEGAPADPENTSMWRNFSELLPHIGPCRLARCTEGMPRAFAINIVRYLYRLGDYQSAKTFAQEFNEKWTEASGTTNAEVLQLRRHLSTVRWQLGEYAESRRLSEETFDLLREAYGPDHAETLRVASIYAANLRALGDFRGAQELDSRSLSASEAKYGPRNPLTLRAINNLALDHALLTDYAQARELHKLAYLEQSSATKGVGKWDVQMSYNSLARVVRLCGDYPAAIDVGRAAHAYGRRELAPEHPLTLMTAKDLSIALRRNGDVSEALELAQETFTRLEKLFGRDNPESMAAAIALANTLREAGHLENAFALTRDTLPRYRTIYGQRHPYSFGCQTNLALLYRLRGDAGRAREEDTEAYEGLVATLGPDHEYAFTAAVNLAGDLAAMGDSTAARRRGEQTLGRLGDFFGEEHFLTLAAAINLSIDMRDSGAEEEAEKLSTTTMQAYKRTLRPDHPDVERALKGERIDWDFDPPPL